MLKRKIHNGGFTLIEMLIAFTITVIILGALYGTFAATTGSVSRCRTKAVSAREVNGLFAIVARELRCCVQTSRKKTIDADGEKLERNIASFSGPGKLNRQDALHLITTSGAGQAGFAELAYRLDEQKRMLQRRCGPADSDAQWQPFAHDVSSVKLEYFDGANWQEQWDSVSAGVLPQAVRLTVAVGPAGQEAEYICTAAVAAGGQADDASSDGQEMIDNPPANARAATTEAPDEEAS